MLAQQQGNSLEFHSVDGVADVTIPSACWCLCFCGMMCVDKGVCDKMDAVVTNKCYDQSDADQNSLPSYHGAKEHSGQSVKEINLVQEGHLSKDQMFQLLAKRNEGKSIIYRIFGFLLIVLSLNMIVAPITAIVGVIGILGQVGERRVSVGYLCS